MIERTMIDALFGAVERLEARVRTLEGASPNPSATPSNPPQTPNPAIWPQSPPNWRPVYHKRNAPVIAGCGRVALYLTRLYRTDEVPGKDGLADMRLLFPGESSYRAPQPQDRPTCSACAQPIDPYSSRDLDWSAAVVRAQHTAPSTPETPDDLPVPNPPRASSTTRRVNHLPEAFASELLTLRKLIGRDQARDQVG